MRLGVHVPIAGGLTEAVARAKRLACTTMQIFSRSPRGGPAPRISADVRDRFDADRRAAGIEPLAVHAPYIINLASPDPGMWKQSLALYRDEYERSSFIKADFLVTHVGSHRGQGEEGGIARVAEAVTQVLAGLQSPLMILLENTAGSGQGLGYSFEHLAAMRDAVQGKERVGICLDTAHLFAAGFPIHTADGLEETLRRFDRLVGLRHVRLIHLNDSKAPFEARVDRHWHIGQGHIGAEAFRRIVTHPSLAGVPLILETPKTTEADDRRNLRAVRALAGAAAPAPARKKTVRRAVVDALHD
jgi:deoxyribonuclease-4